MCIRDRYSIKYYNTWRPSLTSGVFPAILVDTLKFRAKNYANSRVPALRQHKRTALQPSFSLLRGHSAFLNTVSGAVMTTRVLSATDPVRNALPPTTECSPITVSPPRMEAPE